MGFFNKKKFNQKPIRHSWVLIIQTKVKFVFTVESYLESQAKKYVIKQIGKSSLLNLRVFFSTNYGLIQLVQSVYLYAIQTTFIGHYVISVNSVDLIGLRSYIKDGYIFNNKNTIHVSHKF